MHLSNKVRNINLSFAGLFSEIVTFMSRKKSLYEFPQKCFITTERHSLAVCGWLCWEKQFLLIFIPFTGLIKNSCLNKSKFYSGFAPFKHGKKKKILTISVLFSEIVTFMYKKKSSPWSFPKMLQNNWKA